MSLKRRQLKFTLLKFDIFKVAHFCKVLRRSAPQKRRGTVFICVGVQLSLHLQQSWDTMSEKLGEVLGGPLW